MSQKEKITLALVQALQYWDTQAGVISEPTYTNTKNTLQSVLAATVNE